MADEKKKSVAPAAAAAYDLPPRQTPETLSNALITAQQAGIASAPRTSNELSDAVLNVIDRLSGKYESFLDSMTSSRASKMIVDPKTGKMHVEEKGDIYLSALDWGEDLASVVKYAASPFLGIFAETIEMGQTNDVYAGHARKTELETMSQTTEKNLLSVITALAWKTANLPTPKPDSTPEKTEYVEKPTTPQPSAKKDPNQGYRAIIEMAKTYLIKRGYEDEKLLNSYIKENETSLEGLTKELVEHALAHSGETIDEYSRSLTKDIKKGMNKQKEELERNAYSRPSSKDVHPRYSNKDTSHRS